ncbi:MAG: hypothetical protein LKJ88_07460 [Bacilli bacterium]|jgi:hypothetical protein|nr:hypothetical protein [Bacilli bacterium]
MDKTLEGLLKGFGQNHMLPFFWQHGEDEKTLREYVGAIKQAGCDAFCVESRPHPDFCGPKWWQDMDVILKEAKSQDMKVWILDDSHFPTGYAAGAVEKAPDYLCRQSVYTHFVDYEEKAEEINLNIKDNFVITHEKGNMFVEAILKMTAGQKQREFNDDRLLAVQAFLGNETIDLTPYIKDGVLIWNKPEGKYRIGITFLTRNAGYHRNYINMMSFPSCKLLLDNVYEKHYEHYKQYFGKTILGFFSDEPELGNGLMYMSTNFLGTNQDLPWSEELEKLMDEKADSIGQNWRSLLYLLNTSSPNKAQQALIRYVYMDSVSRLVEKDFSHQIADWCHQHGVMYIGHVIEDSGHHCKTGSSLGHYFRGLDGQDMSGIDDIGNQVLPQREDNLPNEVSFGIQRDGPFYHYGLAALGASAAAIEPRKKGRAMCEIFGAYGWEEGMKLMSYLADHFLVRNINNFVPHAFSPKAYPDPDCPPHFYAHGHNPEYPYCGLLFRYMNRAAELFSNGHHISSVGVIYHGEAEWAGKAMPFETPLRKMYDEQIFCDVLPSDIFTETEHYKTVIGKTLKVNTQEYKAIVVPEAEFIPQGLADGLLLLKEQGCPVFFVNSLPKGIIGATHQALKLISDIKVVKLEDLGKVIDDLKIRDVEISPASERIRILHYSASSERYMIVNEAKETWEGEVRLPTLGHCARYQAMDNTLEKVNAHQEDGKTVLKLKVEPLHSFIIVFDEEAEEKANAPLQLGKKVMTFTKAIRSQTQALSYPNFIDSKEVSLPDRADKDEPAFSGIYRYEFDFSSTKNAKLALKISDADEGVQVFLNGYSLGKRTVPEMIFNLEGELKEGTNHLMIEVSTTLFREWLHSGALNPYDQFKLQMSKADPASGLTGEVGLFEVI